MKPPSKPFRALIAVGLSGSAVVVATDGPELAADIENVSDQCPDLGIDNPGAAGLWLWRGVVAWVSSGVPGMPDEVEPDYRGTLAPVNGPMVAELVRMKPPAE